LVVEGSWWWREALLRVLERQPDQFEPTAVDDVEEARQLIDRSHPDLVILDLDALDAPGLLRELRGDGLACLAIGSQRDHSRLAVVLGTGASYVVKEEIDPDHLGAVLRLVARHDALFLQATRRTLARLLGEVNGSPDETHGLTRREAEVLALIGQGRTNSEISAALHLEISSVKKIVSRVLRRLGVRNRTEAALLYLQKQEA
jgi:DNA-binding NarL/FixJ family response regulator